MSLVAAVGNDLFLTMASRLSRVEHAHFLIAGCRGDGAHTSSMATSLAERVQADIESLLASQ